MVGRSTRSAAVVIAAATALLAGTATIPAAADPAISCGYRLTSWPGGFSADLTILNNGPAINGWTVRMTFPGPATLLGAWRAAMTQSSPLDMVATNLPFDDVISSGRMETFGWTATSADSGVPTSVTVNGTTC
jgi:hypothetical protein